jgi:serine protease Do
MDTLIDTSGSSLGFAVPVNVIKKSVEQLKTFGKVSKPYMGIAFVTITKAQQILYNLTATEGALVKSVVQGGPAAAAGIQAGDVIAEINHEKLSQTNEVDTVIGKYPAGTQVLVTYLRNGEHMDAPVILQEFKDSAPPTVTIQLK